MTKSDVLKVILKEKSELDNLKGNYLISWFWKIGFREIIVNEDNKSIECHVDRPNQLISYFRKPIVNFLVHIQKIFKNLGYEFVLIKYKDNEYYKILLEYLDEEIK